ncbi:14441_t:CDS:2 [Entrophospora sp. SA101]|nr:1792_t:CDS:2 [Entrophospora sp. SA101]CAJ0651795.1 14441_t:CDS:2 [Entrophospora sp. SA101]CAJ0833877.1 10073_t:CDS:2 [Entrophospora sp. SA101]CAJ0844981.1 6889_t:CDS:2 [Entrophospora sp. SA101]CAJ0907891.1 7720_t:CDS:2 [Entrophospora sp. SA101]
MAEYMIIFQPFIDLFNQGQVQTILLAWLPTKLSPYLSGIMAVDMFLMTITASGITTLLAALYLFGSKVAAEGIWNKNAVTVQIEYYATGMYGNQYKSTLYEAISWIISQQTKKLSKETDEQISIEYKGKKFNVKYNMPDQNSEGKDDGNGNGNGNNFHALNGHKAMPSIFLTTVDNSDTSVNAVSDFLSVVTRAYLESQKESRVRLRYERIDESWYRVQALSSIRGLDTVALDETQEQLIRKELDTFTTDKEFYHKIGMPYRRGILLYGKPGTGKTSLINAISSQLNRDLYYLNLKNVFDDNELNAAFSSIPANQIVVLEDVDTQSKVLHKRTPGTVDETVKRKPEENNNNSGAKVGNGFSSFSLSTFLGCLDGHIMSEGNFIIMTTNHVEALDPACIRPGRMDVHLNLEYCTHYQIKKMYKNVTENPNAEFPQEILVKIPEKLLPPCEVMMTMILYRKEIDIIPEKILELIHKYQNMKPEEIAKLMEDELRRIEEASANNEKLNTELKEAKKDDDKEMSRTLSDGSTVVEENDNVKDVRC